MNAPWQLDRGIYLEDRGLLLPWLASRDELLLTAAPSRQPGELEWHGTVLGGLAVAMSTHLGAGTESARSAVSSQHSENFVYMDISRVAPPSGKWSSARYEYASSKAHLLPALGPTPEMIRDGMPYLLWERPDFTLSLSIGERFMEYCNLRVSHASARHWRS